MERYDEGGHINVGTGIDHRIQEIAEMVRDVVHPKATLRFDPSRPDGTPRKVLDVSRIHDVGWKHEIDLRDGIAQTYEWYLANADAVIDVDAAAALVAS
jgi:GDP-L-fucose synthase